MPPHLPLPAVTAEAAGGPSSAARPGDLRLDGRRRRPKDRGVSIAQHATQLFVDRGYHAVRMEDIAEACGVTVRALYRHYPTKQALLSVVIHGDQDRLLASLGHRGVPPPDVRLEPVLRKLAAAAVESSNLGVLWQCESRHLAPADLATVREGLFEIVAAVRSGIVLERPDMAAARADLRAWATVSVLTNVGPQKAAPVSSRVELLVRASLSLIGASPPAAAAPVPAERGARERRGPLPRREQLLWAAAGEFRRSGYGGVTLDAIGSRIGIAGPAVYRYFPSKAAVLAGLIDRFQEWSAYAAFRVSREAWRDDEVFLRLVGGYTQLAVDATDLLAVAVSEVAHLGVIDAERALRRREDQCEEWAHWLRTAGSPVHDDEARLLAVAARATVEDLARTPHLARRPDFVAELLACLDGLSLGAA